MSKHLRFRDLAEDLFKDLAEKNTFDFKDIETVSRSFAHEYLIQKNKIESKVVEVNMDEKIRQIFEIVKENKRSVRFNRNTWTEKEELVL